MESNFFKRDISVSLNNEALHLILAINITDNYIEEIIFDYNAFHLIRDLEEALDIIAIPNVIYPSRIVSVNFSKYKLAYDSIDNVIMRLDY